MRVEARTVTSDFTLEQATGARLPAHLMRAEVMRVHGGGQIWSKAHQQAVSVLISQQLELHRRPAHGIGRVSSPRRTGG